MKYYVNLSNYNMKYTMTMNGFNAVLDVKSIIQQKISREINQLIYIL